MRMISTIGIGVAVLAVAVWVGAAGRQTQAQVQHTVQSSTQEVCLLKVSGMTCGGCAAAVKMAAKRIDGVNEADVSLEEGTARVTYDPAKTSPDAIATTITGKTGFGTEVAKTRDTND